MNPKPNESAIPWPYPHHHAYGHNFKSGNLANLWISIAPDGRSADYTLDWKYQPTDQDDREFLIWKQMILLDMEALTGQRYLMTDWTYDPSTRIPVRQRDK